MFNEEGVTNYTKLKTIINRERTFEHVVCR